MCAATWVADNDTDKKDGFVDWRAARRHDAQRAAMTHSAPP
jgi:hypothetical protein